MAVFRLITSSSRDHGVCAGVDCLARSCLLCQATNSGDSWPIICTMSRKRNEPKAKKSVAVALLRNMQGTAADKLALFEELKARGGFAGEDRAELLKVERMLRTFAATEK